MTATELRPGAGGATAQGGSVLAGTGTLIRFILRRDRIRIPVWIAAITLSLVGTAASFPDFYATQAERQARAMLMANPGARAFSGPGHGLEDYTFGAMLANEMLSFVAIFVALMSLLMVVRHTRAEEAAGRAELVRATVVGRHANLAATLTVVVAVNVVLGAAVAGGVGGLGITDIGWSSSWLFGAALAAVGISFAAAAAFTAQVTEHSRGASGLAGLALGLGFTFRAIGDMGDGTLSWLSPIGWAQATRVYVDDRWWPLLLAVAFSIVVAAGAFALSTRRDVAAGLVRPRPGPPAASERLATPFGLALRLHRTSIVAWTLALFAFGGMYGTFVGEIEGFIEELAAFEEFLAIAEGATVIESWLAIVISFLALVAGVFVIVTTLRLRTEETAVRAEPVLATATSRARWAGSHLAIAMLGSVVLMVVGSAGLGLSAAASLGDWSLLPDLVSAGLAYVPALWLVAGVAVALFGLVPQASAAAWVVVAYGLTLGMLGAFLQFPEWMFNLSPFAHVPLLPADDLRWMPLLMLTAIAGALVAAGLVGFRRRDLTTT